MKNQMNLIRSSCSVHVEELELSHTGDGHVKSYKHIEKRLESCLKSYVSIYHII
jgi:hypothetical protein